LFSSSTKDPFLFLLILILYTGGIGVPDGWKRYAEAVEMVCRMGGKGMPEWWK
jgi:hypothetical protein